MKKLKFLGLLVTMVVLALSFAVIGCSSDSDDEPELERYQDLVIPGRANNRPMETVISTDRTVPRQVLTPANGDSYLMRFTDATGGLISQGTITVAASLTGYSVQFNPTEGAPFNGTMTVVTSAAGTTVTLIAPGVPAPGGGTYNIQGSASGLGGGGGGGGSGTGGGPSVITDNRTDDQKINDLKDAFIGAPSTPNAVTDINFNSGTNTVTFVVNPATPVGENEKIIINSDFIKDLPSTATLVVPEDIPMEITTTLTTNPVEVGNGAAATVTNNAVVQKMTVGAGQATIAPTATVADLTVNNAAAVAYVAPGGSLGNAAVSSGILEVGAAGSTGPITARNIVSGGISGNVVVSGTGKVIYQSNTVTTFPLGANGSFTFSSGTTFQLYDSGAAAGSRDIPFIGEGGTFVLTSGAILKVGAGFVFDISGATVNLVKDLPPLDHTETHNFVGWFEWNGTAFVGEEIKVSASPFTIAAGKTIAPKWISKTDLTTKTLIYEAPSTTPAYSDWGGFVDNVVTPMLGDATVGSLEIELKTAPTTIIDISSAKFPGSATVTIKTTGDNAPKNTTATAAEPAAPGDLVLGVGIKVSRPNVTLSGLSIVFADATDTTKVPKTLADGDAGGDPAAVIFETALTLPDAERELTGLVLEKSYIKVGANTATGIIGIVAGRDSIKKEEAALKITDNYVELLGGNDMKAVFHGVTGTLTGNVFKKSGAIGVVLDLEYARGVMASFKATGNKFEVTPVGAASTDYFASSTGGATAVPDNNGGVGVRIWVNGGYNGVAPGFFGTGYTATLENVLSNTGSTAFGDLPSTCQALINNINQNATVVTGVSDNNAAAFVFDVIDARDNIQIAGNGTHWKRARYFYRTAVIGTAGALFRQDWRETPGGTWATIAD